MSEVKEIRECLRSTSYESRVWGLVVEVVKEIRERVPRPLRKGTDKGRKQDAF